MINFNKDSVWDLKPIELSAVRDEVKGLLVLDENVISAFKTIRDQLIFTNKRIIAIDIQGLTGTRKSFASMPYSSFPPENFRALFLLSPAPYSPVPSHSTAGHIPVSARQILIEPSPYSTIRLSPI